MVNKDPFLFFPFLHTGVFKAKRVVRVEMLSSVVTNRHSFKFVIV